MPYRPGFEGGGPCQPADILLTGDGMDDIYAMLRLRDGSVVRDIMRREDGPGFWGHRTDEQRAYLGATWHLADTCRARTEALMPATTITVKTSSGDISLPATRFEDSDERGLTVFNGDKQVARFLPGAFLGYHLDDDGPRVITEGGRAG